LFTLYAAQSTSAPGGVLTPSPTTPGDLRQIAVDLGITLPADYQALVLRYNLAAVEVNFSRFYPPVVRPMGLSAALTALLTSGE
jgi:hypothetical protein